MEQKPRRGLSGPRPRLNRMCISIADGKKLIGNPCLDTIYKLIGLR